MSRYTIKLHMVFSGVDTLVIDLPEDREVGETVKIGPTQAMKISDGKGGSVTLTPGVSFTGEITAKD